MCLARAGDRMARRVGQQGIAALQHQARIEQLQPVRTRLVGGGEPVDVDGPETRVAHPERPGDPPREQVAEWLRDYHARGVAVGLPLGTLADFTRGFDLAGVQRHLKATGIFARLWHRDGKAGYLADIPRVMAYLRDVGRRYRELEPLVRLIDREVLPRLAV